MIVSLAVLTIHKGHQNDVVKILSEYTEKEKKVPGCLKAYFRKALNNDDTYLVYAEYDTLEHFQAADKMSHHQKEEKVEFVLRPHLIKGFYGNFE